MPNSICPYNSDDIQGMFVAKDLLKVEEIKNELLIQGSKRFVLMIYRVCVVMGFSFELGLWFGLNLCPLG